MQLMGQSLTGSCIFRYDLNGRQLQGEPARHSIYIQDGRKHIQP